MNCGLIGKSSDNHALIGIGLTHLLTPYQQMITHFPLTRRKRFSFSCLHDELCHMKIASISMNTLSLFKKNIVR